jgi:DNA replication and repair protein RecF
MRVEALRIKNFRNIRGIELLPNEGANIIFGDNAQGKTNLLEAIWLFSGAKSFRGAKDGEFVRFGEKDSALALDFFAQKRGQTAEISFIGEKKTAVLNEIKQESVVKLAGEFCAVVFSPDHLALVKQGAEKRRKFIDTSLCQAYPKYIRVLESYTKILRQRNFLLKDIPRHPELAETLEAWDDNLINCGAYVTHMRGRYVKKLAALAAAIYDGISSGKEIFSARYLPGTGEAESDLKTREELRESFGFSLKASLEEDIRSGVTTRGPHRDDIEITIGGASARNFGSQGQQRSCILALKLAECGILEERNAEPPIILLDDVMSELDQNRREYLLNRLEGKQTFMTCCDAESFSSLKEGGLIFQVRDGAII